MENRLQRAVSGMMLTLGGIAAVVKSPLGLIFLCGVFSTIVGIIILKRALLAAMPPWIAHAGKLFGVTLIAAMVYLGCISPIFRGIRLAPYLAVGTPADALLSHLDLATSASATWEEESADPKAAPITYPVDGGRRALKRPVDRRGRPVGIKSLEIFRYGPLGTFVVHTYTVIFGKDGRVASVKRLTLQ